MKTPSNGFLIRAISTVTELASNDGTQLESIIPFRCLLNRRTGYTVPRVRIPPSPPILHSKLTGNVKGSTVGNEIKPSNVFQLVEVIRWPW